MVTSQPQRVSAVNKHLKNKIVIHHDNLHCVYLPTQRKPLQRVLSTDGIVDKLIPWSLNKCLLMLELNVVIL